MWWSGGHISIREHPAIYLFRSNKAFIIDFILCSHSACALAFLSISLIKERARQLFSCWCIFLLLYLCLAGAHSHIILYIKFKIWISIAKRETDACGMNGDSTTIAHIECCAYCVCSYLIRRCRVTNRESSLSARQPTLIMGFHLCVCLCDARARDMLNITPASAPICALEMLRAAGDTWMHFFSSRGSSLRCKRMHIEHRWSAVKPLEGQLRWSSSTSLPDECARETFHRLLVSHIRGECEMMEWIRENNM